MYVFLNSCLKIPTIYVVCGSIHWAFGWKLKKKIALVRNFKRTNHTRKILFITDLSFISANLAVLNMCLRMPNGVKIFTGFCDDTKECYELLQLKWKRKNELMKGKKKQTNLFTSPFSSNLKTLDEELYINIWCTLGFFLHLPHLAPSRFDAPGL
jgi:hypothetical protein